MEKEFIVKANRFEILLGCLAFPHIFAWFFPRNKFGYFFTACAANWLIWFTIILFQDQKHFYWIFVGASLLAIAYVMFLFLLFVFKKLRAKKETEILKEDTGIPTDSLTVRMRLYLIMLFMPLPFSMVLWRCNQGIGIKLFSLLVTIEHFVLFVHFQELYTHWLFISSFLIAAIWIAHHLEPKKPVKSNEQAPQNKLSPEEDYLQQIQPTIKQLESYKEQKIIRQLKEVNEFYQNFTRLLNQKFSPNEQTYKRYLDVIGSLYKNVIGNCKRYVNLRLSIDSIDIKRLKKQLSDSKTRDDVRASLQARVELYENVKTQMAHVKSNNEKALTKLITITISLSALQTKSQPSSNLNDLIEEINLTLNESYETAKGASNV